MTCCPVRTPTDDKRRDNGGHRDFRGSFMPGNRYGQGRPRGSKNRLPLLLDVLTRAVGEDTGEAFILEFARRYPARFRQVVAKVVASNGER